MRHSILFSSSIALLTGLSLLSCTGSSEPDGSVSTAQGNLVSYACKDGVTFSARLSDQEAIADLPNNPNLALPRVESASGAKYSDGTTTLWDKGGEAFVESNGDMLLVDCQATPSAEIASDQASTQTPIPATSGSPQSSSTQASTSGSGIRTERVQFASGSTSAVVENAITGYAIVDYVLGAQAGQSMNVSMATDNSANYFNILAPGETEVAMFNSSISGNQYEGTLPESGDYKIRVYLMRSAARRNEVANYRLEMIVAGQASSGQASGPASSSGSSVENDARVPGTDYHATGNIPCAMSQSEPNGSCAFGVVREGNGNGFVEVTASYGNTFSIYFQNGEAVGAEGGSGAFSSTRSGDETFVYIGEERYVIPDAVIFGG